MTAYRADIDGLRAVAVLPVIFYHAGIPPFSGGFAGVDVFFVISGFLICSIIRSELLAGNFSILRFYERRFRRILPALFAMLVPVSALAYFVLLPIDLADFGRSVIATSFFSSNIYFMLTTDYFSGGSDLKLLLHTWSLAVEEQFYIVMPLVLLMLFKLNPKYIILFILVASVASFAACIYVTFSEPDIAFYFPATRAWELGAGAAIAYAPVFKWQKGVAELVGATGVILIGCSMLFLTSGPDFPGFQAALPVIGAVLVIWSGCQPNETFAARILSLKPVVFVGRISYSLYLWHWPVLVFASYCLVGKIGVEVAWLCLLASFALATASFFLVETPVRRSRWLGNRREVFAFSAIVLSSAFVAGYALTLNGGWQSRVDERVRSLESASFDYNPERRMCHGSGDGKSGPTPEDIVKDGPCKIGNSEKPASFILMGDSHAETLRTPLSVVAEETESAGFVGTYTGCPPASGGRADKGAWHRCADFNSAMRDFVLASHTIKTIFLAGFWQTYLDEEIKQDGLTDPRESKLAFALLQTIREYQVIGARVVLVDQVPTPGFNVPSAAARRLQFNSTAVLEMSRVEYDRRYQFANSMIEYLGRETSAVVLSPADVLCASGTCIIEQDGHAAYSDDDHLSRAGSSLLSPLFEPLLGTSD